MLVIHNLLSAGNRVIIVDKSSMRFGIADRGATPAKPNSTARMTGIPWVRINAVFASTRSSLVAVRFIMVLCKAVSDLNEQRGKDKTYQEGARRCQRVPFLKGKRADSTLYHGVEQVLRKAVKGWEEVMDELACLCKYNHNDLVSTETHRLHQAEEGLDDIWVGYHCPWLRESTQ